MKKIRHIVSVIWYIDTICLVWRVLIHFCVVLTWENQRITFLSSHLAHNESCGAPYGMNTSGAASGTKDPPQVANERPGAVRPLNSDDPNDAASCWWVSSACNCVAKNQKKYGNYLSDSPPSFIALLVLLIINSTPTPRHHRKGNAVRLAFIQGRIIRSGRL